MVGLLALLERCCCVNHRKFLTILPLKVCRGNQTLKNMPQEDNFKPNLTVNFSVLFSTGLISLL